MAFGKEYEDVAKRVHDNAEFWRKYLEEKEGNK